MNTRCILEITRGKMQLMSEWQEIRTILMGHLICKTIFNNGNYVGLLKQLCNNAVRSLWCSNLGKPHGVHHEKADSLTFNQNSLRCAVSIYIHTHATLREYLSAVASPSSYSPRFYYCCYYHLHYQGYIQNHKRGIKHISCIPENSAGTKTEKEGQW